MGAFLDKPETEKTTSAGVTACGLPYAMSCMQGWRMHMEDAHTVELELPGRPGVSFFAVFDGHGGKTVAQASGPLILSKIVDTEAYKSGDQSPEVLGEALTQGLFSLDTAIKSKFPALAAGHDRSGSTVITAFTTPKHIVIGNCGDSRALVARNNAVLFASDDHKPSNAGEMKRIQEAGGYVEMNRVCGNLAVSRALGDFEFKDRPDLPAEKQKICCHADVTVLDRNDADEFLLLACDGIWDVISNEGIVIFVNYYLERGRKPEEIVELILDYCLDMGSKDNMSAMIVLLPGAKKANPDKIPPSEETEEQKSERLARERAEVAEEVKKAPQVPSDAPPAAAGGLMNMMRMAQNRDDEDSSSDEDEDESMQGDQQRRTSEAGGDEEDLRTSV